MRELRVGVGPGGRWAAGGLVWLSSRHRPRADPADLYAVASLGGSRRGTGLLEFIKPDGDGHSLVVVSSALRVACTLPRVRVEALNENGKVLVDWFANRSPFACQRTDWGLALETPHCHHSQEEVRIRAPSPIDVVRTLMLGLGPAQPGAPMPVLFGTFAYDFLEAYEQLPPARDDPTGWPDYELWLPDRFVWYDHRSRTARAVTAGRPEESASDARAVVDELTTWLEREDLADDRRPHRSFETTSDAPEVDLGDEDFAAVVERVQEHIRAGDVFQIVPSRTFSLPCGDPLQAYLELRSANPSPYHFYLVGSAGILFGASPEMAVGVRGNPRRVTVHPIAGTRPRGRAPDGAMDEELDIRLEAALRFDEKELAEHMMLVDLARNDVARVSEPGSRQVDNLLTVERYSQVMHLVSHVSGLLREDFDALHAYVATMNMGTLVGAPKVRAAQLLRRYEATRRGPYGGAVGYVGGDGSMDTAIVIRSAVVQDGRAHVRAGCGVVHDSIPRLEADETRSKANAVLRAIRAAGRPPTADREE